MLERGGAIGPSSMAASAGTSASACASAGASNGRSDTRYFIGRGVIGAFANVSCFASSFASSRRLPESGPTTRT